MEDPELSTSTSQTQLDSNVNKRVDTKKFSGKETLTRGTEDRNVLNVRRRRGKKIYHSPSLSIFIFPFDFCFWRVFSETDKKQKKIKNSKIITSRRDFSGPTKELVEDLSF